MGVTLMGNHTSAMLGILIGETGYRGHGYGVKAIKLMLKFCFEELGMHRVWLNVNTENNRAIKCYEKAGFKVCGTEHEVQWARGRWWDAHHMEILAQDYFKE